MPESDPFHTRITGLETSLYKVRDRVVEIDKAVSVHDTLLERYGRDLADTNSRVAAQFGKIEASLESIMGNQEVILKEQSFRKGAINMLAWGIGLFCTVASLAVAVWAVISKMNGT